MDDLSSEPDPDRPRPAASGEAEGPAPAAPKPRRVPVLPLIVACAFFMENLDSSVIATSLPEMARSLNESPITLKLAMTSYMLALAVWLPASGWLADRFGARTIFRLAIGVFAIGSIGCGFASTIGEMVAFRIVQGLGGAMMVPVGRLIVLRATPRHELVDALAWMTIPGLVGPLLGPLVGGFITTFFEWRWIFWVNVPIAILGLVLATIFVPNIPGESRTRFDLTGFTLTGFGILAFVAGSAAIGIGGIPAAEALMVSGVGAALLVGYLLHSRRHASPLLDVTLFNIPSFRIAIVGGVFLRIGVGAGPFLLPLLMQYGFGMTAFQSGAVTFVLAIGAIGLKTLSGRLMRSFGFRRLLLANAGITAVLMAIPGFFLPTTPLVIVYAVLLVTGFVRAMQMTASNVLVYVDIPPPRMSHASTLAGVVQQIAASLGISAAAFALQTQMGTDETITAGLFYWPFVALAALTLVSVPLFWRLAPDAGRETSGHRSQAAPRDPH